MVWKSLPDNYKRLYLLSVRFSQFVYLLRVFYNHLYDCRTGNEKGGEKQFETFQSYRAEHLKDLTKRKIEEVLAEVNDLSMTILLRHSVYLQLTPSSTMTLPNLQTCSFKGRKQPKDRQELNLQITKSTWDKLELMHIS